MPDLLTTNTPASKLEILLKLRSSDRKENPSNIL